MKQSQIIQLKEPPIVRFLDKMSEVLAKRIYLAELERDRQLCAKEIVQLQEAKKLRPTKRTNVRKPSIMEAIDLFKRMEFDARKHIITHTLGGVPTGIMGNGTTEHCARHARHNMLGTDLEA
jgi:hypothetical protein